MVLRREPVRIVVGRVEGGYTDAYEHLSLEGRLARSRHALRA